MKNLNRLLRHLRGNEPLRNVAQRAGISHTYLNQLEKGTDKRTGQEIQPSAEILHRLAQAYNYPYEELLKAAGYLSTNNGLSTTTCHSPTVQKLIHSLAHAQDLEEKDYDIIADLVERLIKYAQNKNHAIKTKKKTD